MKRERLTQIVLVIVGLLNLALIYFLYMDLRHSSWLLERKNECDPMFLSFFIPVGVILLMAARRPSEYRSMIALAAWWNISHGVVMAIETVEAWIHKVHRNFADVIVLLVTGVVRWRFCQQNERQSRQELRERAQKPNSSCYSAGRQKLSAFPAHPGRHQYAKPDRA